MKIVVCSDNHRNYEVLNKILNSNPDADYYFHLGDSEMEIDEVAPFASVRGNVDFDMSFPYDRIIDVCNHSIYLIHGNSYDGNPELLAKAAKMNGCDIVLFGHTHRFLDTTIDGIRVINPGSCSRSKDGFNSYAIININDQILEVKRINL